MDPLYEVYRTVLDHYFGSILITDQNLNIIYANHSAAELLLTDLEHLLTLDVSHMLSEGLADARCILEATRTKKTAYSHIKNRRGRALSIVSHPHLNSAKEIDFVLTYSLDELFYAQIQEPARIGQAASPPSPGVQALCPGNHSPSDREPSVLIAESNAAKKVFQLARQVAPTDASVMLYGESGVGKEIVAKYIFEQSQRSQEAFFAVNCAAIPEPLMEAEFFGYEAGAFTGALSSGKAGLFELADQGTLFLDEIGEMPLAIQSKFLRVLESKCFRRLGGTRELRTDVRLIAATNQDLYQMVQEGRFRSDLFYRLNIIPISIPPLRERKADILALSQLFLDRMNERSGACKTLSKELVSSLQRYSWPGNVRELRNLIERLYVVSPGDSLSPCSGLLPVAERPGGGVAFPACGDPVPFAPGDQPLRDAVDQFERSYIECVLEACGGNRSKAAKALGIHRTALYQKLQKLQIEVVRT